MKSRLFGCKRFRRLSYESADRILSVREISFLDRHREVCPPCVEAEHQSAEAFDMLRSVALEAHSTPQFEDRVLRKLKVSRARDSFTYWSPAFVGAGIACLAMFAALQTLQLSTIPQAAFKPGHEGAMLINKKALPRLILVDSPRIITDSFKR